MREASTLVIHREDYAPPAFWIRSVDLTFDLDPAKTMVINRMQVERNREAEPQALRLHGEGLNLSRVLVNGESVSFRHDDDMLVIDPPADETFTLEIRNACARRRTPTVGPLHLEW